MTAQRAKIHDEVRDVEEKYLLSRRGAYNGVHRDFWGPRSKKMANLWTPENKNAAINFRLAENNLLHEDIAKFFNENVRVETVDHLTYHTGPQGSLRLRKAISRFLNEDFHSYQHITPNEIFMTPGLASAIDSTFWGICNEGEGIIIPRPLYNGFRYDIEHRTGAVIVQAEYEGLEGYSRLDDVFDPAVTEKALERALSKAKENGIVVKAVMITNPHNPLGRCYPIQALKTFAKFCGINKLHFVSDEIYAHSVFHNPSVLDPVPFTSTLAINLADMMDPSFHHVLYGASKDFCANGLRLGFICSRNTGLMSAISSNAQFSWSPHVVQDVWAAMFEDNSWRNEFFAKNSRLMADRYAQATAFLREKGIGWFESYTMDLHLSDTACGRYTGVFIWIDLRRVLLDNPGSHSISDDTSAFAPLKVAGPGSGKYIAREGTFADICSHHGVNIARGSLYSTEEYGWFRITFTMPSEPLLEGLQRVWSAVGQIQVHGWNEVESQEWNAGSTQANKDYE